ncbi:MAG: cysteine desulfurase family protein [Candidatus Paceibacterota bacterium]|jgi:cysteine desulfurase
MADTETQSIYLDYAATTPFDRRVVEAMAPYMDAERELFGNPGSLHGYGQMALAALDDARHRIARVLTAHHDEIVFTGSATEANNLVLRGAVKAFVRDHPENPVPRIIVSAIEHPSVLNTARLMAHDGEVELIILPVTPAGVVDVGVLEDVLNNRTALVSCMWVNNETGIAQPIDALINSVEAYRHKQSQNTWPLVHVDAVQAMGLWDINMARTSVDFLTMSAHKLYGPKGVGAMYVRGGAMRGVCVPVLTGGDQEYGLRAGTENVAGSVGLATALELCGGERVHEYDRLEKLSLDFFNQIHAAIPSSALNGDPSLRAPHIMNVYFPGCDRLWLSLDVARIAVSAGSACRQRQAVPSHVLAAMGCDVQRIAQSTRFSFGRQTTKAQIDEAVRRVIMIYKKTK